MLPFTKIIQAPRVSLTAPVACWVAMGLTLANIGCNQPSSPPLVTATPGSGATASSPKSVHAQGQIMPAQGIIRLYTTPGDVVVELPARVGDRVKQGDVLARMRSEKSLLSQQMTLTEQKKVAIRERDSAIEQATLKLSAAQMKVDQVKLQRQAVDRQTDLIEDAEQQVAASERVFERLRNIANDALTREFVGQLEVDRQRLTIDEARSRIRQQHSSRDQALEDLQFAETAAKAEVDAARTLLVLAEQADPASVFDAQLAALQIEVGRAVLQAPIDGTVLAVHTTKGGSVVQTPLIELANLDSIVCEFEVNVAQARWIELGHKVQIKSNSIPEVLTGVVSEKSQVVGKPRLRSLDPLAAVDYRTLSVIVALDKPELASQWLQLQVEGQIDLSTP